MEHLSPDEHLPLALQVILPLLIICITECGQNFAAALLPQYGHLRVVAAQNAGVPIYFVIFFHIRLSSHIRERLASAHGLLPSRFFLMIVLLMTEGDLLFLLSAQGLAVGAVVHGGTVHHGISTLTAFQTAAKPNQMVRKTTMPIMAPMADLLGLTRDTACLAFQFGDGLSNCLWPTAMVAIMAGLAGVKIEKWYKFFVPCFIAIFVVQALLMVGAVMIGL